MNGQDGPQRPYDVVLFGATGFVGGLTAEYLLGHAPSGCRLALAGRDRAKLERLRERLAAVDPARAAGLGIVTADVSDPVAVRALAESTRVVASTVGPYIRYGEELVAACAEAGTDYTDLTGEPEFVDLMFLRYGARARETGARIVHACGFDSLPHDLGVYFTVRRLPEGVPLTVDGFVQARGLVSGGTLASSLTILSRRVFTELTGGDPGYGETAKMFAEASLCLALDDLPATAGQVTPAVAMGDALLERLAAAGLPYRVRHAR
ncbi:trans-acting enoyl reductase family protein [Streptomyces sp. UNOB3_S3]|uniref:saccharopine dehydrogenase family protein n=1 Tax=Streptomyces sp. UNOB3_S3 TaxID=2871682 RepID=UPI001E55A0B3|nr:saccharopine dehydrogenase NADP-binding domain-containing protein [Streptomyces sp. UNOB3_S3]MCC3777716.1 saccharopine dehydrogenase NADP-binding domain-containing protein [Streptomyces sp. UNOB3_S3]